MYLINPDLFTGRALKTMFSPTNDGLDNSQTHVGMQCYPPSPPSVCMLERRAFIIFCAALGECDSTLPINCTHVRHGAGVFAGVLRTLV